MVSSAEIATRANSPLCSICAKYDWEYHIGRYGDDRLLDDQKEWNIDKKGDLFLQKTDKNGGLYSLGADSTRFFLGTYEHMLGNSARCEMCCLTVCQVKEDARCAAIADSKDQLLCLVHSSSYDYSAITIGAPAPSTLQFEDTALVSFTVVGNYLKLPKRSVVDARNIRANLLRDWLSECSETHSACARAHLSRKRDALKLDTFKVIDVESRLVVPAPKDAPYVALSYVWGQAKIYKAQGSDFIYSKKRHHDGTTTKVLPLDAIALPATVEDAMRVVQQIGQRYLWVDALCITQDDPIELQATLQQMHLVYGCALVTICAMDGESADAGLARIRPSNIQNCEPIANLSGFIVVAADFYEFPKMKWATRAWTYQESVYSTRCILFTSNRVFYSCILGLHSEERETGITITSGLDSTLPHHREPPRYQVIDTASSSETAFDEYDAHVESFAERQLSYQSDVLNAFTAVMSDMSTKLGLHFVWGLPTAMFELALCWVPCIVTPSPGDGVEHDCLLSFPNFQLPKLQQHERRKGFPSWSWAGRKYEAAVIYTTEIRSILQSQGTMAPHIIWPWKCGDGSSPPSISETGILDIEVEFLSMTRPEQARSFLIDGEDNNDLHFDDLTVWKPAQRKACIRICDAITTFNIWDGYGYADSVSSGSVSSDEAANVDDIEKTLTVFLSVSVVGNGMYERDGLFVMQSVHWDEQQPHRKQVQLC
ncbi:HET-domain-containing protein [Pyrenochaeta sp. DS3sAY3a]|nr:HET-domain-containing protein [Pyrenochaeta sp. DS3sAY3a]